MCWVTLCNRSGWLKAAVVCSVGLAYFFGTEVPTRGQVVSGTITGTIKDSSAAVVPEVSVILTNLDTQQARTANTDRFGNFTFPGLPPGHYRVKASQSGFKSENAELELQIDQTAHLDMTLQVGTASESITVSADTAQLQTETATMGQVLSQQAAVDLPLNGRNFLQLATLSAGAVPVTANNAASDRLGRVSINVNIAGGRGTENSYLLDGIEMRGSRLGEISTLPSPDFIKEFKIQQNYFSAEYGDSPAIISVSTQSGTNQFHGGAYEFLRNSDLDARNFFDGASPPPYKQNQFGANLSGPIKRNKTFFFGGWEGQQIREATTQFATVPNPQWLTGNFSSYSGVINNPLANNAPFPGNMIPTSLISKIAMNYNAYIPAPNTNTPQGNYTGAPSTMNDYNQFDVRVDHNFSPNDSLFGRYLQSNWNIVNPGLTPYSGSEFPLNGKNVVLQEAHIFSPSVVNSFKVGFSREYAAPENQVSSTDLAQQVGFQNTEVQPYDYSLPRMTISGYTQLGHSQQTFHQWTNTYAISDTLSLIKGRHTISVGFDIRENRAPQITSNGSNGRLTFNGQSTGNAVADYLLGAYQSATVFDTSVINDFRFYNISAFAQDDFKVSGRLTLNLGVRWEYNQPWQVLGGTAGYFDPSIPGLRVQKPLSYFGLNVQDPYIAVGGVGNSVYKSQFANFGPRIGLAYRLTSKTVIRAGFGIFYAQLQGSQTIEEAANPGASTTLSYTNSAGKLPRLMDTLFDNPAVAVSSASLALGTIDPGRRNPYVEQWNFNIQRELPGNMIAQIAYTGSEGHQLGDNTDINTALLNAPGQNLSVAARRPFPQFSGITEYFGGDNSNYEALSLNLERRFAAGFSLLSNYTWSKSIDDNSGANSDAQDPWPLDRHLNRALSAFDVPNRFTVSAVWELPIGHGKSYFGNATGALGWLATGWQINSIVQLQSGLPFTITESGDQANIGFTGADERPIRLAGGAIPNPTATEWFNTAAFVVQPLNSYGNSGRDILFGNGTKSVDLSLFKNNFFGERHYNLQFRGELFNLLNNVNLGPPNAVVNGAAFGAVKAAGPARQIQFAMKFLF